MKGFDFIYALLFGRGSQTHSLQELGDELKDYLILRRDFLKLDLMEKLIRLFSISLLVGTFIFIGFLFFIFLFFSLAFLLAPCVGGIVWAFAIMSAILLVCALIVYVLRKRIIVRPVTRFVAKQFISK